MKNNPCLNIISTGYLIIVYYENDPTTNPSVREGITILRENPNQTVHKFYKQVIMKNNL